MRFLKEHFVFILFLIVPIMIFGIIKDEETKKSEAIKAMQLKEQQEIVAANKKKQEEDDQRKQQNEQYDNALYSKTKTKDDLKNYLTHCKLCNEKTSVSIKLADLSIKELKNDFLKTNKKSSFWFEQVLKNADGVPLFYAIFSKKEGDGCHVCTADISINTWKSASGNWEVLAKQKNLFKSGIWGDVPSVVQPVNSYKAGSGLIYLVELKTYEESDIKFKDYMILNFKSDGWGYLGTISNQIEGCKYEVVDIDVGNGVDAAEDTVSICWNYKAQISVLTNNENYPDILIKRTGTVLEDDGSQIQAKDVMYSFNGKEYVVK
jgi:hypothetical protein